MAVNLEQELKQAQRRIAELEAENEQLKIDLQTSQEVVGEYIDSDERLRAEIAEWRRWYGAWLDYLPEGAAEQINKALREDEK